MKIYLNTKARQRIENCKSFCGSMGSREVELTEDAIKAAGLEAGLKRLTNILLGQVSAAKQYASRRDRLDIN